jgi:hypothetical protein
MPLREDDLSVANEELLWRRIPDTPMCVKKEDGQLRPSSVNFLDDINELSVNRALLTTQERVLQGHETFGLISLEANVPRANNHIIASDPEIDPEDPTKNDPSHYVLCHQSIEGGVGRKKAAKKMAKAAGWIVLPASHRD